MPHGLPRGRIGWTFGDGHPLFDQSAKAAALSHEMAAAVFGTGQEPAPGGIRQACPVGNEKIDELVADDHATSFAHQPAGALLGRLPYHKRFLISAARFGWRTNLKRVSHCRRREARRCARSPS